MASSKVFHVDDMRKWAELSRTGNVIADFYATWCGPCKAFGPIFEAASAQEQTIKFIKVNVDSEGMAELTNSVASVPTVRAYKNGVIVTEFAGANPTKLMQMIETLKISK